MNQKDIRGVAVLLCFAVLCAFLFNQISPFGIALFGQWENTAPLQQSDPEKGTTQNLPEGMAPETVLQIIRGQQRTVIDVRNREAYREGHLPSALSFPLSRFDENVPGMLSRIKQSDPLLIYCSSFQCPDSHTFALYLKNMGFTDVKVFSGGFELWQEQGYTIETD